MIPAKAVRLSIGTLMAADTNWLNQAVNANELHLFANNFVPTENNVPADFTEPTFTGYALILQTIGPASTGIDPVTGEQVVDIPFATYKFQATADTTPPQTIYGFFLTTKTKAALIAFALFPVPIVIQYNGQQITFTTDQLRVVLAPVH